MAYATTVQLQAYLGGGALPPNAARLLDRASELIDYITMGRIETSIVEQANAAQKATCQQVEFWMQVGEDRDINNDQYESLRIGSWSATYNTDYVLNVISPRAKRTLYLAGMLYRGVRMI
jgi:hypothetical protein